MKRKTEPPTSLDRALADWRATAGEAERSERLSEATRQRILHAARGGEGERLPHLASLFLPLRRVAWSAALPAAALALLLGALALPGGGRLSGLDERPTGLEARKQGDEVIFVIANGGEPHRVYRLTRPGDTASGEALGTADSAFRDRLDSGNGLVYYRID